METYVTHPSGSERKTPAGDGDIVNGGERGSTGRRRFTRNAVLGSTAILSLGNRAAWGEAPLTDCVSAATWGSYDPKGDNPGFLSVQPGQDAKIDKINEVLNSGGPDTGHSHYPDQYCPVVTTLNADDSENMGVFNGVDPGWLDEQP
jgi:hypothetical protein